MKSLTGRQKEFLDKLLDLYYQEDAPVHYSIVAERLGVGKVTAYEMLRLLEERGLVQVEYQRPEDMRGPGRSSVVFRPTPLAAKVLVGLANGKWSEDEWEEAKTRILDQLRAGETSDHEVFLEELLSHLPNQRSPTVYLTQMVTAIALGLHSLKGVVNAGSLRKILGKVGLPGELDLSALAGLSVGLSLVERINQRIASTLLEQTKRFHKFLAELNAENRHRLAEFTREILDIVGI